MNSQQIVNDTTINIPIWNGHWDLTNDDIVNSLIFYPTEYIVKDVNNNTYSSSFLTDAPKVADFCATRLGYPISQVELTSKQFLMCFEQAIIDYSNIVNEFAMRDYAISLQNMPIGSINNGVVTTNVNLTGVAINPTLSRILSIAKAYGTEAQSGGYLTNKSASVDLIPGKQIYDLSEFNYEDPTDNNIAHNGGAINMEIRRVYYNAPPSIVKYYDPMVGTGYGNDLMMGEMGLGNCSPSITFLLMPLYDTLLRTQEIDFDQTIRRSGYSFDVTGTRLRIFPIPNGKIKKLWIEYINATDRDDLAAYNTNLSPNGTYTSGSLNQVYRAGDITNYPFKVHDYNLLNGVSKQWILKYCLSLCKETLGNIRNKYNQIPIPDNSVTLNGSDLVTQAQNEQNNLRQQLNETLDAMSRQSQLQRLQAEGDITNSMLQKTSYPRNIYIG